MNRLRSFAALFTPICLVLLANTALAHPGHSLAEYGPVHLVTSPYHLLILVGAGTALWGGAHWIPKKLPRRSMQTVGVLLLLAAGLLWGFGA
jgi:hypothetical protein